MSVGAILPTVRGLALLRRSGLSTLSRNLDRRSGIKPLFDVLQTSVLSLDERRMAVIAGFEPAISPS
jgi:hypothetical protein